MRLRRTPAGRAWTLNDELAEIWHRLTDLERALRGTEERVCGPAGGESNRTLTEISAALTTLMTRLEEPPHTRHAMERAGCP